MLSGKRDVNPLRQGTLSEVAKPQHQGSESAEKEKTPGPSPSGKEGAATKQQL